MDQNSSIHAVFYSNPDGYPPIVNSARLLANHGAILHIWSIGEPKGVSYPPQVEVHRFQPGGRTSLQRYLSFIVHVIGKVPDSAQVMIGHDMHGFLPARLLSTRYRRPLIYHCHDFALESHQLAWGGRLVSAFERRWARTADLVIVPDKDRGQVIRKSLHLPRDPVVVANSPLQSPAYTQRLQESLQANGKCWQRIVLRQGQIGPGHALEATIRSLSNWQRPDWGLALLGGGDPAFKIHLQQLATDLNVLSQVSFLPEVNYDEVAQYTVGADLGHGLYEPTHANNLHIATASNKLMEYMAAGLPILASDRPNLRALIERYDCGLTADESDPASIAAAVNTLLGDPQRARQMGANGARAFDEEFRYDKQFAPVLAAITEMATRRRS